MMITNIMMIRFSLTNSYTEWYNNSKLQFSKNQLVLHIIILYNLQF